MLMKTTCINYNYCQIYYAYILFQLIILFIYFICLYLLDQIIIQFYYFKNILFLAVFIYSIDNLCFVLTIFHVYITYSYFVCIIISMPGNIYSKFSTSIYMQITQFCTVLIRFFPINIIIRQCICLMTHVNFYLYVKPYKRVELTRYGCTFGIKNGNFPIVVVSSALTIICSIAIVDISTKT